MIVYNKVYSCVLFCQLEGGLENLEAKNQSFLKTCGSENYRFPFGQPFGLPFRWSICQEK